MVVFDGILHQVGKHTAKQHIAADNSNILPFTREGNPVALGQRGEAKTSSIMGESRMTSLRGTD